MDYGVCNFNSNRDDYAKAKCSTCDGYYCGEEEKCEMVEEKPTCKIVQTGCDDNDKYV